MPLIVPLTASSGIETQFTADKNYIIFSVCAKDLEPASLEEAANLRNYLHYAMSLYLDFLGNEINYADLNEEEVERICSEYTLERRNRYNVFLRFDKEVTIYHIRQIFGSGMVENSQQEEYSYTAMGLPSYVLKKFVSPESHQQLLNIAEIFYEQIRAQKIGQKRLNQFIDEEFDSLSPLTKACIEEHRPQFKENILKGVLQQRELEPLSERAQKEFEASGIQLPSKSDRYNAAKTSYANIFSTFQVLSESIHKAKTPIRSFFLPNFYDTTNQDIDGVLKIIYILLFKLNKKQSFPKFGDQSDSNTLNTTGLNILLDELLSIIPQLINTIDLQVSTSLSNQLFLRNLKEHQKTILYVPFDMMFELDPFNHVKDEPLNQFDPETIAKIPALKEKAMTKGYYPKTNITALNLDEEKVNAGSVMMHNLFREMHIVDDQVSQSQENWYQRFTESTKHSTLNTWLNQSYPGLREPETLQNNNQSYRKS